jgi:hypothetical protein
LLSRDTHGLFPHLRVLYSQELPYYECWRVRCERLFFQHTIVVELHFSLISYLRNLLITITNVKIFPIAVVRLSYLFAKTLRVLVDGPAEVPFADAHARQEVRPSAFRVVRVDILGPNLRGKIRYVWLELIRFFKRLLTSHFPYLGREQIVLTLFRRLFRVHAHIFHSHLRRLSGLGKERSLHRSFRRLMLLIHEFELMGTNDLEPLLPVISRLGTPLFLLNNSTSFCLHRSQIM